MTLPHRTPPSEPPSDVCASIEPLPRKPRTRAECVGGPRPCPWLSCRQHLYAEVNNKGRLRVINDEPESWGETCALDVADYGPCTHEEVGELLGLSRNSVMEVESTALRKLAVVLRNRGIGHE